MTDKRSPTIIERRTFLKGAGATSIVLLGFPLTKARAEDAFNASEATRIDAWIAIKPDSTVVIQVSQAEMGQGIHTTFPAIIADEMDADWSRTELVMAPLDPAYFNPNFPQMFTGNAESTRTFWPVIRKAGASARDMLLQAAAAELRVPKKDLTVSNSVIRHGPSNRSLFYGELAQAAATMTPPEQPRLKSPDEWTLLRRSLPRRELLPKVTGAPIFGLDATVEGMVYAAVRHAETPNGTIATFDRESVLCMQGVLDVIELPGAVAVVADSTWRAIKGARLLNVTFTPGDRDDFSSASLNALYDEKIEGDAWTTVEARGDVERAVSETAETDMVTADYGSAWQAHAPMEPMNCIANVRDGEVFILGPTQGQTVVAHRVAAALDVSVDDVSVERTFLGGGFGRRLVGDYAVQAALVSRAVGRPAQIVWTREEDMRHDFFRPHVRNRIVSSLADDGYPSSIDQTVVSPTILSPVVASPVMHWVYPQPDPSVVEGMTQEGFLYGIANQRVRSHVLDVPVPTMVWRTTGYGPNVFAIESFVDELAARADVNPLAYRIALLERMIETEEHTERREKGERAIAALRMLDEKVTVSSAAPDIPPGRATGIAFSHCFETFIAQAVDVSVDEDGALDIHKVTTVLDGGYVLDPDITQANIEGGIYWGLTQALTSEITFENGRTQQSNFDTFEILALPEAPPTELHWIDSGASLGGLGEVGPVATTPALTNAIAAATGRRLRTLPLSRHGIHTRYRKQYLRPVADPATPGT